GFISPGDRVDVLMTHQLSDTGDDAVLKTRVFTETILSGLRVLAIEQSVDDSSGQPVIGRTVTMEVLPKEAETLALGARMGELSLVLHGAVAAVDEEPAEPAEPADPPFTSDIEISKATTSLLYATEAIVAEPPPAPVISVPAPVIQAPDSDTVKIYRSTTSTTQTFSD
ncbi:MAG: Flp pilus assembly protein CpaB, partial [Alphaproteobacteria bacterium]